MVNTFTFNPMFLIHICALGYIMVSLFSRGNVLDIIFCGAATTSVLVFLHWWVPIDDVMGIRLEGGLPVLIGVLVGVYVLISLFKKTNGQKKEKVEKGSNPLWDIRIQARYVFNRKTHIIFWILAVVQSMLAFFGYSILTFWAS